MSRNSIKQKIALAASLAMTTMLFGVDESSASVITYNVNQFFGGGSVIGTLTTDGNLGTINYYDITSFSLELNGNGASFHIASTDPTGVIWGNGADITASAQNLKFNFSATDNGFLVFQDGLSSGFHYYCLAASSGACLQGQSSVPGYYSDPTAVIVPTSGNLVFATAAVPEPETWGMMLIGFAGLGFAGYRRAKSAKAAALPA
jgi:hypothetical protein